MIEYFVKSILCLAILHSFYKLFLEQEKMHLIKRVFLLVGLPFALIVPFLNTGINLISDISAVPKVIYSVDYSVEELAKTYNWEDLFIIIVYFTVFSLLLIRLIINIIKILYQIKSSEKLIFYDYTIVLVMENIAPHSFHKYIFLSKKEYLTQTIPNSIIEHEITHVRQKHTLDILIIELIKLFWWYNPIIYFWKLSMQLNHEFLADENVVRNNVSKKYQKMLLQFANVSQNTFLTSNINFQITKKRFKMMTKKTSQWRKAWTVFSVLPIAIFLMLFLGNTVNAQTQNDYKSVEAKDAYFGQAVIRFMDEDGKVILKKYSDLTKEEKEKLPPPPPPAPKNSSKDKPEKGLAPLAPGTMVTITPDKGVHLETDVEEIIEYSVPPPPPPPPSAPPARELGENAESVTPPPPPPSSRDLIKIDIRKSAGPPKTPKKQISDIEEVAPIPPPPPPPPKKVEDLIEESEVIFFNDKKVSKKVAKRKLKNKEKIKNLDIKTDGKTLRIDTEN